MNDRQLRSFPIASRPPDGDAEEYRAEGYATTFDAPYTLCTFGGVEYLEQITRDAFKDADMRDVLLLYNHGGNVLARTTNGTLELSTDDNGLLVRADLSKSAAAKALHEEIRNGLVTQMSFAFTIREQSFEELEKGKKVLCTIRKIDRLFDVSAVSYPANSGTSIGARGGAEGLQIAQTYALHKRARIALLKINREV